MPRYVENTDDYRIKYAECYVRYTGSDKTAAPVVRMTDRFRTDEGAARSAVARVDCVKFNNTANNRTTTDTSTIKLSNLDLAHPLPLGAINMPRSVIMIQARKPDGNSRYRRLPCEGNIRLFDPFKKEREALELRGPTRIGNFFVLKAWGNNKYPDAPSALETVMNHERMGYAFSPAYFFGISHAGDGIFLYKYGKRIARVNTNGEVMLKPVVSQLKEQLTEFGLSIKEIER